VDLSEALARLEIQEVLWRYARGVDRVDHDTIVSAYHPGATDAHTTFSGAATDFARELVDRLAHLGTTGQHHITNMSVELDGPDDARVESYFLAFHPQPGDESKFGIAAGRYLDHFRRRDGKWAIAARRVVMDWTRDDFGGPPWAGADGRPEQGRSKAAGDPSYAFFAAPAGSGDGATRHGASPHGGSPHGSPHGASPHVGS
jgi:hypothetical protein